MAGLGGDLSGHGEQIGQVVDRPVQPPAAAPGDRVPLPGRGEPDGLGVRAAQRPAGVAQQRLGLGRGAFGQPGQLAGDATDRDLSLVAGLGPAQAQLGPDLSGSATRGTTAIPQRSRSRVRVAPPAPCTRRAPAAIRVTALASSPKSVG